MSNNAPAQPAPKPQATDPEAQAIRKILDKAFDQVKAKFPHRRVTMDISIEPLPQTATAWTRGNTRPLGASDGRK